MKQNSRNTINLDQVAGENLYVTILWLHARLIYFSVKAMGSWKCEKHAALDLSFRTRKLGSTEHRNIRLLAGTLHNKRFLVVRQKRLRNLPTKTSRVFTTTTQFTFPGWCSVVCKQISGRFCSRNISLKFYINRLIEVLEERLIYFVNVFFWFNLDMHLMAGECSLSRII